MRTHPGIVSPAAADDAREDLDVWLGLLLRAVSLNRLISVGSTDAGVGTTLQPASHDIMLKRAIWIGEAEQGSDGER